MSSKYGILLMILIEDSGKYQEILPWSVAAREQPQN